MGLARTLGSTIVTLASLSLTAACTSSEGNAGGGTSPLAPCVSDPHDAIADMSGDDIDAATDATTDSEPTTSPIVPGDGGTPPAGDPPGTCGTTEVVTLAPLDPPTCAPLARGFRRLASPGDLETGVSFTGSQRTAFTGTEAMFLGTKGSPTSTVVLLAYDLAHDTWRKAPSPASLKTQLVFGEGLLYAASHGSFREDGAETPLDVEVYDPATDLWATLPPGPVVDRFRTVMFWAPTSHELVIWGGTRTGWKGYEVEDLALADGAAWNPKTKTWRVLAKSPLTGRFAAPAWDGEHLVVAYGGRYDVGEGTAATIMVPGAALYDPAKDEWRKICDPPATPDRIASVTATIGAAGSLAVLWAGYPGYGGDGDDIAHYENGAIFDRATLTWRLLAAPPGDGWSGGAVFSSGGKLWSWGLPVSPGITGARVFDPSTNTWSTVDDIWGPPPVGPSLWTGCDLIMHDPKGWSSLRPE